jgi:hypothetical protein
MRKIRAVKATGTLDVNLQAMTHNLLPFQDRIDSLLLRLARRNDENQETDAGVTEVVHLHRNLNQKQHIFAFQISPATVVKLLVSIASSRIRKGQF